MNTLISNLKDYFYPKNINVDPTLQFKEKYYQDIEDAIQCSNPNVSTELKYDKKCFISALEEFKKVICNGVFAVPIYCKLLYSACLVKNIDYIRLLVDEINDNEGIQNFDDSLYISVKDVYKEVKTMKFARFYFNKTLAKFSDDIIIVKALRKVIGYKSCQHGLLVSNNPLSFENWIYLEKNNVDLIKYVFMRLCMSKFNMMETKLQAKRLLQNLSESGKLCYEILACCANKYPDLYRTLLSDNKWSEIEINEACIFAAISGLKTGFYFLSILEETDLEYRNFCALGFASMKFNYKNKLYTEQEHNFVKICITQDELLDDVKSENLKDFAKKVRLRLFEGVVVEDENVEYFTCTKDWNYLRFKSYFC